MTFCRASTSAETRFIANVSGSTIEEYERVTRRFDDSEIDAIEINISCPNVKEGGVAFGNDPEMSARVVAACRAQTSKPIITKLSPNQTDIKTNARLCIEAGTDGFSVINTLMGMAIDAEKRKPIIGNVQGGLSGPAIKPIALLKVHQVYEVAKAHGVPIIGQGGITTPTDAIEFIIAGAAAVGVGTALFYDPLVCKKINAGISDYLERHDIALGSRARGHAADLTVSTTRAIRQPTIDCFTCSAQWLPSVSSGLFISISRLENCARGSLLTKRRSCAPRAKPRRHSNWQKASRFVSLFWKTCLTR